MLTVTIKSKLKELGWIAIFFLVLAAITLPAILLSRYYLFEVNIFLQGVIVVAATWVTQKFYGGSIRDLIGKFDSMSLRNMILGFTIGSALMLVPATILSLGGWVQWKWQAVDVQPLFITIATVTVGAITEEVLFRGFIFQRLLSLGVWPAQILISGYFLLTHINNPAMDADIRLLAMTNIFLASIVFGITVIQTRSLFMAITLHAAANLIQGTLLGFGVSGHDQPSLLMPIFNNAPVWLTGGSFGLEGSLPGLICVAVLVLIIYQEKITVSKKNNT